MVSGARYSLYQLPVLYETLLSHWFMFVQQNIVLYIVLNIWTPVFFWLKPDTWLYNYGIV